MSWGRSIEDILMLQRCSFVYHIFMKRNSYITPSKQEEYDWNVNLVLSLLDSILKEEYSLSDCDVLLKNALIEIRKLKETL